MSPSVASGRRKFRSELASVERHPNNEEELVNVQDRSFTSIFKSPKCSICLSKIDFEMCFECVGNVLEF